MKTKILLGIISIILILSACQPSAPESEQNFCQSLGNLAVSLKDLKTANAQNDQEVLQDAWDDTVESYGEVRDSADQMSDVRLIDLQLAWRNLEITVGAALGVSSTAGSTQGIEKAWDDVKGAYDELFQVNCESQ